MLVAARTAVATSNLVPFDRQTHSSVIRRRPGGYDAEMSEYSVYILRCSDGSYYTGIAVDVEQRLAEHNGGRRGAKYLRGRGPLELVFSRPVGDRGTAQHVEARLKKLPRHVKADADGLPMRVDEILARFTGC